MINSKNKTGQVQIAIALSLMATFIGTAIIIAWNSNLKSDKAVEKVSEVQGDIKSIRSNINAINNKLNELSDYFKLVPKSSGKINTK